MPVNITFKILESLAFLCFFLPPPPSFSCSSFLTCVKGGENSLGNKKPSMELGLKHVKNLFFFFFLVLLSFVILLFLLSLFFLILLSLLLNQSMESVCKVGEDLVLVERERENGVIVFIERDSEKTRDRKRLRYCLGKSSMPLTSFAFCSVKIKYNLNKECNKYRKGQIKKEWRFLFGQN